MSEHRARRSTKRAAFIVAIVLGLVVPVAIVVAAYVQLSADEFIAVWDPALTYLSVIVPTFAAAYTGGKLVDHRVNGRDKGGAA